jgi:hypothetical protein
MRARHVALVVSLGISSSAIADTKPAATKKCGDVSGHAMLPFELLMDAPTDAEIESASRPTYQSSRLLTEDFRWDVRIWAPKKEELDFAKARQAVIASSKKAGSKLTWKTAGKTADGYRLLYATEEKDGSVVYSQVYLRTIQKKKWLCTGVSEWADSHDCLARACESLRAAGS